MAPIMDGYPATHKPALRVIDLTAASAREQQAVADVIAERLTPDSGPVAILADPLEPFLSAGANQNIERDIDLSFCRDRSIPVIRRRLGGGGLYIDRNQLIFYIIVPARGAPWRAPRMLPIVAAAAADTLRDIGISARVRTPGDVEVVGRKISGTAGAEVCDNVVVGGTFLLDLDPTIMARCLRLPSETYRARIAKLFERSMTTMRLELGQPPSRNMLKTRFVANLARCLDAEPHEIGLSGDERAAIAARLASPAT